jgi:leader peptidase (prepilin peptidase)/N-methyltransferase
MMEASLAALLGLLIGSFLNVCIFRLPRDLSVVRPRSFCPLCEHPIAWYDNIPLASFLFLRGRCRHCRKPISWRYPLVEALTAASFFWFLLRLGPTPAAARACVLASILITLIFSDIEERILPDEFTLGIAAGLALSWLVPIRELGVSFFLFLSNPQVDPRVASLAESAAGAAIPAAFLWLTGWLYERIRKKEGLGLGDVKMIAMLGAFLGLRGALETMILGSLAGSLIGILYIKLRKKNAGEYPLPFGSFLGAAALLSALVAA